MRRVYIKEEVCIGCHLCEIYCQLQNAQSSDLVKAFKRESPRPLPRVRVDESKVVSFSVRCQQCNEAPCVQACITGALSRDSESPLVKVKLANPKLNVVRPYTSQEIVKLLTVCDHDFKNNAKFLGSRNRAVVLMLLDTGLRISELASIKLEDIEPERGWIKVKGKGAKERVVRIGATAQKALWRYMVYRHKNNRVELWLTEEGRPIKSGGLQIMIRRLKERAGVVSGGNCHKFRHTFALNFLRQDRNPFNLQYLLGHSDLRMVKHYVSTLGMEDALKAHEKASPADLLDLR